MSYTEATARAVRPLERARPVPRPTPDADRRDRLRVVRTPDAEAGRGPFVVVCGAILALALLGALLLNLAMSHDSFTAAGVQKQLSETAQDVEQLQGDLDTASSPASLAKKARSLGMVERGSQGFLRLSDGKVLGDPVPAR